MTERRRAVLTAGVVAALLGSAGCDNVTACTLIGCLNGLRIEFTSPATEPYRLELRTSSDGAVHVYECRDVTLCGREAFIHDFLPGSAQLTIRIGDRVGERSIRPEYRDHYPNGRRCGPACRNGTARVTLP